MCGFGKGILTQFHMRTVGAIAAARVGVSAGQADHSAARQYGARVFAGEVRDGMSQYLASNVSMRPVLDYQT